MNTIKETLEEWIKLCEQNNLDYTEVEYFINSPRQDVQDFLYVVKKIKHVMDSFGFKPSRKIRELYHIRQELRYWNTGEYLKRIVQEAFLLEQNPYDLLALHDPRCDTLQGRLDYIRYINNKKEYPHFDSQLEAQINTCMDSHTECMFASLLDKEQYHDLVNKMLEQKQYEMIHKHLLNLKPYLSLRVRTPNSIIFKKSYNILFPEEMSRLNTYFHNKKILMTKFDSILSQPLKIIKHYVLDLILVDILLAGKENPVAFVDFFQWIRSTINLGDSVNQFNDLVRKHNIATNKAYRQLQLPLNVGKYSLDLVQLTCNLG